MTRPCTKAPRGRAARAATEYRAHLPILTTARLTLRAPRIDDLDAFTRIYLDSSARRGEGAERAWETFSRHVAGWLLHGHGLWSVDRREDCELLGFVRLGLEWKDAEPELGWMFLPEHRHEGYATEAAEAAQAHGFALLGTGRFVSYIAVAIRPLHAATARRRRACRPRPARRGARRSGGTGGRYDPDPAHRAADPAGAAAGGFRGLRRLPGQRSCALRRRAEHRRRGRPSPAGRALVRGYALDRRRPGDGRGARRGRPSVPRRLAEPAIAFGRCLRTARAALPLEAATEARRHDLPAAWLEHRPGLVDPSNARGGAGPPPLPAPEPMLIPSSGSLPPRHPSRADWPHAVIRTSR